jgi:glycosyltransferase involved in cell wall biosynthesis
MRPTISVILPVYNESETLDKLKARLAAVLEQCVGGSFEVLFVDDGSRDGSDLIINGFHDRDPRFKAIHFSRNFGHQAALQAGLVWIVETLLLGIPKVLRSSGFSLYNAVNPAGPVASRNHRGLVLKEHREAGGLPGSRSVVVARGLLG